MLTVDEFTAIANVESIEEKKMLCGIYDISYETFSRLWPIEQFGRAVLEYDIILLQIEHVFQANPAYFDPEDQGPRMFHFLVITYSNSVHSPTLAFLNSDYSRENRITVDEVDVTPSLEKAIARMLGTGK